MSDGEFLRTSCGSPNYAAPEVISGRCVKKIFTLQNTTFKGALWSFFFQTNTIHSGTEMHGVYLLTMVLNAILSS